MNDPVFVPNNPSGKLPSAFNPLKPEAVNPDTAIVIPVHKGASMFKKPGSEVSPTKKGSFLSYIEKANIRPASSSDTPKSTNTVASLMPKPVILKPTTGPLPKRELSDEVKKLLEADSAAFVSLAQKKEAAEEEKNGMDPWDEAILLGKYPEGRTPIAIETPTMPATSRPKTETSTKTAEKIPEKPASTENTPAFPARVFEKEPAPAQLRQFNIKKPENPKPIAIEAPKVSVPTPPRPESIASSEVKTTIPKKPAAQEELPAAIRLDGMIPKTIIPRKPLKAQVLL